MGGVERGILARAALVMDAVPVHEGNEKGIAS